MSRTVIKSQSAFLIAGNNPSYKTGHESGYLFPLVQSSEFSIESNRQSSKQVGSQNYAVDDLFRAPEVKFSTSYYASPYLVNEYLMGFDIGVTGHKPAFSSVNQHNQNFYLIIDGNEGQDAFDEFRKPSGRNLSGVSAISLGNCFLSDYSLSFNVGSVPVANASFVASNIQVQNVTGAFVDMPAINLQSGNASGVGVLNLEEVQVAITGQPELDAILPEYNLPVTSPSQTQVFLKNLQMGSIPLEARDTLIQSFNLSVNVPRQELYGLGSNHVYGRKALFPLLGSAEISVFVSGLKDGNIADTFVSESGYDLEVEFQDPNNLEKSSIIIQNAKLESYSFGMQVNDKMLFNARYSFQITESGGLLMNTAPNPSFNPDEGFRFLYLFDGPQVFLKSNQAVQILDPDAEDYFSRIFAAGSSISSVNQVAVNNFIVGCKADGIWSAIKASCLLAGPDTLAGAIVPLVGPAPTNFNFVAGDYNRVTGLKGDGSTKYLDSNRNNNADPQDNCSSGAWVTEMQLIAGTLIGSTNANGAAARNIYRSSGSTPRYQAMCNNGGANATVTHSTHAATGFVGISRNEPSDFLFRASGATDNIIKESTGSNTNTLKLFRQGNAANFTDPRIAFYFIGESLDLAALDARLTTYMASIQ
jgi:hypothetical protein